MRIGYARISTSDQNLDMQIDALKKADCSKIFEDIASGAKSDRDGLSQALNYMREGDTLVVWKLDRLGRSLKQLIEVINQIHDENKAFISLQESIDTTTPGGKLVFHVFGALAEFERDLIRERTNAGLVAARARGKIGGRPRVMDEKAIAMAKVLMADEQSAVRDICEALGISKATLYRYLNAD